MSRQTMSSTPFLYSKSAVAGTWVKPGDPIKIAIPFDPTGEEQVSAFGVDSPKANSIYSVSSNDAGILTGAKCDEVSFIPHCHGTHTECVGHIVEETIRLSDVVDGNPHYETLLITVKAEQFTDDASDTYPKAELGDWIITEQAITDAISAIEENGMVLNQPTVLIVRCDHDAFLTTPYNTFTNPPFYSQEAMQTIADRFSHHMTNLPSVDRESDGGGMSNHVCFFRIPTSKETLHIHGDDGQILEEFKRTNTEMCFIPDDCLDGYYFCQLGTLNNWGLDAAPSAPLLYPLELVTQEAIELELGFRSP